MLSKSVDTIAVFDAGVEATRCLVVISPSCSAVPVAAKENVAALIESVSGREEVLKR